MISAVYTTICFGGVTSSSLHPDGDAKPERTPLVLAVLALTSSSNPEGQAAIISELVHSYQVMVRIIIFGS